MNCTREGCTGTIVDGYCDVCGMAPVRAAPPASATPAGHDPGLGSDPCPHPDPGSRAATARDPVTGAADHPVELTHDGLNRHCAPRHHRPDADHRARPPRCRPRRDPRGAVPRPRRRRAWRGRDGAREPALLRQLRASRSAADGTAHPAAPDGLLPQLRHALLLHPKLTPGDLVGGQYEVVGCLAHGGLGWIYLARDRNVCRPLGRPQGPARQPATRTRWQPRSPSAASSPRSSTPTSSRSSTSSSTTGSGYIVMEYVGGDSLKDLLTSRREANGGEFPIRSPSLRPSPTCSRSSLRSDTCIEQGLLFCDFKPDNVIQTQHSLKLIDLGGVVPVDDQTSPVYGTVGYQAPEIATDGPSIASDLFTVARTLAVALHRLQAATRARTSFTLPSAGGGAAVRAASTRSTASCRGNGPEPRRPIPVRRGDGRPAPRRAARGRRRPDRDAGPGTQHTVHRRLPRSARSPGLAAAPRAPGRDRRPGSRVSSPPSPPTDPEELIPLLQGAPEHTVEVDLRLAPRVDRRGRLRAGRGDPRRDPRSATHGSGGCPGTTAWPRSPATPPSRRGPASTPSTRRSPASSPRSLRSPCAPRRAASPPRRPTGTTSSHAQTLATRPRPSGSRAAASHAVIAPGALAAYDRVPESSSLYVEAQTAQIRCLIEHDAHGPTSTDCKRQAPASKRSPSTLSSATPSQPTCSESALSCWSPNASLKTPIAGCSDIRSPTAIFASASSTPTARSLGGRTTQLSASDWWTGPTRSDQGHGHERRALLTCPACGAALLPDDQYCEHCGGQVGVANDGTPKTQPAQASQPVPQVTSPRTSAHRRLSSTETTATVGHAARQPTRSTPTDTARTAACANAPQRTGRRSTYCSQQASATEAARTVATRTLSILRPSARPGSWPWSATASPHPPRPTSPRATPRTLPGRSSPTRCAQRLERSPTPPQRTQSARRSRLCSRCHGHRTATSTCHRAPSYPRPAAMANS